MSQFQDIADKITEHAKTAKAGTTAVVYVNASGYITVGFDPGEVVTAERIAASVIENFAQHITAVGDDTVDEVEVTELRDE
jgi:hypothetical protein